MSTIGLSRIRLLATMKYQIVLQWPASSMADYDRMIDLESFLIDTISAGSEIDGHDAGSGEMNIFVRTNDVYFSFAEIKGLLAARSALKDVRIAYREIEKNKYSVLWPEGLNFFSLD